MKKLGFTLAEVLITLVIIGVIAAMTVPTLMNNTNQQEFRSALKKAISGVNQALTLHYALTSNTAADYTSADDVVNNLFKKRMSILDTNGTISFTNGSCSGTVFATADGVMFCINSWAHDGTSACDAYNQHACTSNEPNLYIDVNGRKNPNTLTTDGKKPKDIYQASIYAQRVVPYGTPTQQVMYDEGSDTVK